MARIALYNGRKWLMPPEVSAQDYLRRALVPEYPDLQGAEIADMRIEDGDEIYEFFKKAGQKGFWTRLWTKFKN